MSRSSLAVLHFRGLHVFDRGHDDLLGASWWIEDERGLVQLRGEGPFREINFQAGGSFAVLERGYKPPWQMIRDRNPHVGVCNLSRQSQVIALHADDGFLSLIEAALNLRAELLIRIVDHEVS